MQGACIQKLQRMHYCLQGVHILGGETEKHNYIINCYKRVKEEKVCMKYLDRGRKSWDPSCLEKLGKASSRAFGVGS